MKSLLVAMLAVTMVGCASAGADYYNAIEKAASAQALSSATKYEALSKIANSGDPGAATAAVMAIALSKEDPILPQYVESDALKWAQVLTPTVGTLGLGFIQAGVAKNASDNAMQVQMASFASNEAIQLGQQQMVTDLGGQWSATASAGGAAVVELGLAGFNALNIAGDQTVEMGVAGLNTADSIATTGLTTAGAVATAGFTQIGLTAEDGINATGNVGLAGMNHLNEMGQFGMTTVGNVGLAGIDAVGTVGTTGMNLLGDQGTNYAQIIADMQASINAMTAQLANPITCQDDGTGTFVCN